MFIFGHIGYTLTATLLLNNPLHINLIIAKETDQKADNGEVAHFKGPSAKFWKLIKQTRGLDLRFLIIGSLLPDIIDKPIGRYFFNTTFGTGHLFCHTLLFAVILFLAGFIIAFKYKNSFMLMLAIGTFVHLILDGMWQEPKILLWPLFGFGFGKSTPIPFGTYLWNLVLQLFKTPWEGIPELIAAIIVVWFVWLLWRQKKLRSFILHGKV
jgi:inner membrane protein